MKNTQNFKRERPGIWTCLTTVVVNGVTIPAGVRILAGAPIGGVDVGALLEALYAQEQAAKKP